MTTKGIGTRCAQAAHSVDPAKGALAPAPTPAPLTPNQITKNLCGRLFPDQEVMQTACRSRCSDHYYASAGGGQECAFEFARTSREVAPPTADDHTVIWSLVFIVALIATAWFAYRRYGKKPRADTAD